MALARVKTWVPLEVLTASDLNGEVNNILSNALALISPLTGNLDVNNNQLTNLRLEVRTATAPVSLAGRVYWQSSEGTVHMDTGTLIGRVPAITDIQEGRLVAALNPTAVSGATTYGLLRLGAGLTLTGTTLAASGTSASILQTQIFSY